MKKGIVVTAATLAAVGLPATQAFAAGARVYDGTGWHIGSEAGDQYLDTHTWYVEFYDSYSLSRVAPYAKLTAAEITKYTGVPVKVTTIVAPSFKDQSCPGHTFAGSHRIVINLDPATTRSYAWMCGFDGHSDSSKVMLGKDGWDTKGEIYRRHLVSHELGHSIGLGHAPTCNLPGADPLMCGDYWGGYWTKDYAQKYTPYDIDGLKQLVKNRSL